MENSGDWDRKINLVNELTDGMEIAKQLQMHLNVMGTSSSSSSSQETREFLVQRILNSYDKALSILKWNGSVGDQQQINTIGAAGRSESPPRSFSGSPHSDQDSDLEFKDQEHKNGSRKRKGVPRWTKQVQISPGTGLEGPLDDGFSWRKYGQKDILGAKYPRGYYRCTHRNVQGCLATKQVQRSDGDQTIFEITYRGSHTCTPSTSLLAPAPPSTPPEKQEPNTPLINHPINQQQQQQHSQETLSDFQTGLSVITQGLDSGNQSFSPFYFPASISDINAQESYSQSHNNLMSSSTFSPSFMSPATSTVENYFPVSPPPQMTSIGRNRTFQGLDSELAEIVLGGKSATNSATVGLDFQFGDEDHQFEPNFSFDDPGFFQ